MIWNRVFFCKTKWNPPAAVQHLSHVRGAQKQTHNWTPGSQVESVVHDIVTLRKVFFLHSMICFLHVFVARAIIEHGRGQGDISTPSTSVNGHGKSTSSSSRDDIVLTAYQGTTVKWRTGEDWVMAIFGGEINIKSWALCEGGAKLLTMSRSARKDKVGGIQWVC